MSGKLNLMEKRVSPPSEASEVSLVMYNDLRNLYTINQESNLERLNDLENKLKTNLEKLNDLEN